MLQNWLIYIQIIASNLETCLYVLYDKLISLLLTLNSVWN